MVVVDVPSPCCESIISFPHEERLPRKMCKIRVILELDIELCIGHKGLQEAIIVGETGRSTGTSLKAETYITRSPSRYPITNSHSKRCTSLIGQTRERPRKRHKGMEKRDLLVDLIWRRSITPLESSFCDLQSSSSYTTRSMSATARTISWPIPTPLQKHKQDKHV